MLMYGSVRGSRWLILPWLVATLLFIVAYCAGMVLSPSSSASTCSPSPSSPSPSSSPASPSTSGSASYHSSSTWQTDRQILRIGS